MEVSPERKGRRKVISESINILNMASNSRGSGPKIKADKP